MMTMTLFKQLPKNNLPTKNIHTSPDYLENAQLATGGYKTRKLRKPRNYLLSKLKKRANSKLRDLLL